MVKKRLSNSILNEIKDFDIEDEISIEDIEQMESMFENEPQIEPPDNLFQNIMNAIDKEYESKKTLLLKEELILDKNTSLSIKELLLHIKYQVRFYDKKFWLISLIIMYLGLMLISQNELKYISFIAPFVIIISIYYMYKGVYYNVYEMELVCKYSIYETTLARSIIIIFYNILFASFIAIVNYSINGAELFLFIIVSWLAPLLFTYYTTLYFFFRKGLVFSVIANVATWLTYILIYERFSYNLSVNIINNRLLLYFNLSLIVVSGVLIIALLKKLQRIHLMGLYL